MCKTSMTGLAGGVGSYSPASLSQLFFDAKVDNLMAVESMQFNRITVKGHGGL